jgi:hypothetical protein
MNIKSNVWRCGALALIALAGPALLAAAGCERAGEQRLTILLMEYRGVGSDVDAKRLAKELADQGLPAVFVVEGDELASVCAGRYASWKDPQADILLARVHTVRDAAGQFPFAGAMLMPIPEAAPENPWPLEKAKGYFTLIVASWEAPGRMAAAQAFAAELRRRGFEAYVYHGPTKSSVAIGAWGPEIFDNPGAVDLPGAKLKPVSPAVIALQRKFPRMRLEGQEVPAEVRVPTYLGRIPGRGPVVGPAAAIPRALYRISLSLVDTKTGVAEGRARVSGVSQSRQTVGALTAALARQMVEALPAGRTVRVGAVGVLATDADAARDAADAVVMEALTAALGKADKIVFISPEATRQMLDAAGLKPADILRDPRPVKGLAGLEYIVVGSVAAFRT